MTISLYQRFCSITAQGDNGCIWVEITGTHTGEYRGLAPTGKTYAMATVPTYRIVDGRGIIA
ncbi:MAG: ester cyclase [Promethearchaeota archaeon]